MRFSCLFPLLSLAPALGAQDLATVRFLDDFVVDPNITYVTANNFQARVDVYRRRNTSQHGLDTNKLVVTGHSAGITL